MKKSILILSLVPALGGILLTGCSTPATVVDSGSSRVITTVGSIDIQNFADAARQMTDSLIQKTIAQDKLQSGAAGQPVLMAVSRIQNNTGEQIDTDLLVKKIRVALNDTGKVQTSTTMGLGGPEDPIAADQQRANEFFADKKHARTPDYTLSGKIIEVRASAGNVRQSSFVFQLSLSSSSGIAIWEDEKTITKQGSRSTVGF